MSSANAASGKNSPEHADTHKGAPLPRWLPVSLLALTTAALAVPIVLLRRQQAKILTKSLKGAPPPPRRTSTIQVDRTSRSTSAAGISSTSAGAGETSFPNPAGSFSDALGADDGFNGALYSLKAFGYATAMVFAGGITAVWGVKTYMGVADTQEFAQRMRSAVLTYMPKLSSRIHRPTEEEDGIFYQRQDGIHIKGEAAEWNWDDAERRLKAAFEKDGFTGWAEAAMKELEAEGRLERLKRGHA